MSADVDAVKEEAAAAAVADAEPAADEPDAGAVPELDRIRQDLLEAARKLFTPLPDMSPPVILGAGWRAALAEIDADTSRQVQECRAGAHRELAASNARLHARLDDYLRQRTPAPSAA